MVEKRPNITAENKKVSVSNILVVTLHCSPLIIGHRHKNIKDPMHYFQDIKYSNFQNGHFWDPTIRDLTNLIALISKHFRQMDILYYF